MTSDGMYIPQAATLMMTMEERTIPKLCRTSTWWPAHPERMIAAAVVTNPNIDAGRRESGKEAIRNRYTANSAVRSPHELEIGDIDQY